MRMGVYQLSAILLTALILLALLMYEEKVPGEVRVLWDREFNYPVIPLALQDSKLYAEVGDSICCINIYDGKIVWRTDIPNLFSVGACMRDGRLYLGVPLGLSLIHI